MTPPRWIWQDSAWPRFTWDATSLAALLRDCQQAQGQLLGMAGATAGDLQAKDALDTLLSNIVDSSAIEGEQLDVGSVRSSLARRLGLVDQATRRATGYAEGLAELMLDATRRADAPLDLARLMQWHRWLFAASGDLLPVRIRIGELRGSEPMQVVSGRIDRPIVHFEAPPREGLEAQLRDFIAWFNASRGDSALDPLLRAGIAHFWFVTLHPFDDGNGRVTRALTDLALAQAQPQAIRFHAMSASILADRAGYYRVLEASQKDGLDITTWLQWFLRTLHDSLTRALYRIDRVLAKARFWQAHREQALSAEQTKVLNRLLDGGERGFEQGLTARHYQTVAKVSKATATRHLADLLDKGCIRRLPGGGRSTRYEINASAAVIPLPPRPGFTEEPKA
ncbi:Fic family protein [Luteimonas sp. YGD11-2]|uniref:Fic family protein n=1 Tax=Luteimonas sp. YGD11-2 TaxID=2508168 RepID=UPI00100C0F0C|nr:Fic family protein [Luteimonas sp. YGD11-2]